MPPLSERLTFSQRGGWWVVGQFFLLLLILIIPGPDFPTVILSPVIFHLIGGIFIVTAYLILVSGSKSLRKALTPFPYPIEKAPLIQEGIYHFIRHPLYFGVILGGFGVSFWRMNVLAVGLSVGLTFFLNAKADQEEVWLLQKFPEYEAYRKKTKKLIPFFY